MRNKKILLWKAAQNRLCKTSAINKHLTVPEHKKEYYPSAGKALLIFERISEANLSLYNMVLWDVTEPLNPTLIGYISPTMKVAYEFEPGKHTILMHPAAMNNLLKLDEGYNFI